MTQPSARFALALALAAFPADLSAQLPSPETRQFAFVVHYDGTQVKLNEALMMSAGAAVWKDWSADQGLDGWNFELIKNAGEQPPGAYAGWLCLRVPTADSENAERNAKSFLGALEDRLGELLARAPRELAENRRAEILAQLSDCEQRQRDLAKRLRTESTSQVPNARWESTRQDLEHTQIEQTEIAVSLELLEEQIAAQRELCAATEQQLEKLQVDFDDVARLLGTLAKANPDYAAAESKLVIINQQIQRMGNELEQHAGVMAELAARQRDLTARRAVIGERAERLEMQLAAIPRTVPVTAEGVDLEVSQHIEALDRRMTALRGSASEIEQALRRLIPPRITPWF